MNHRVLKYLFDINESIDSIDDYLGEKRDFLEYQKNKKLRRAIEREIEIIGEATNKILKLEPNFKIEYAKNIIATRNIVIHNYDKVDDVIIWGIISIYLPKLKSEINDYLGK